MKEQRMCCIALRHLSGIQKGIQSAHAIVEFGLKYGSRPEYKQWAKKDKTIVLLEAHSNAELERASTGLKKLRVPVAQFQEPDVNNTVTAIVFLFNASQTNWRDVQVGFIKNNFKLATN